MHAHTPLLSLACRPDRPRSSSRSLSFRSLDLVSSWFAPRPSPVLLPEVIFLICSYLHPSDLPAAARLNRTWAQICLPRLYREINLADRFFKIASLELGIRRHGHHCRRLQAAREVNHWCSRIVAVLRFTPNLTDLDATWMNVDMLESLEHLQNLERLSISRLQGSQPDDNQLFEPSFRGSSRIKDLNMADSNQMTDAALISITRTSPNIRTLNVSGNQCVSHQGLIQWCDSLRPGPGMEAYATTKLTTINFTNCNRILAPGFEALFERSRHLRHVNLMSTRVDDAGLQVLARQNRDLETVVLNCCPSISDQGLQTLLRTCTELRVVSFLYCNRITVRVLFQSLWKCLKLQELRFSLNGWHNELIEHGLGGPPATAVPTGAGAGAAATVVVSEAEGTMVQTQELENTHPILSPSSSQPLFYEPHLELLIFGGSELDDDEVDQGSLSSSNNNNNSVVSLPSQVHREGDGDAAQPASAQEYRQRLILTQLYRQLEQLLNLSTLDMRNFHLPLDMVSGLGRLGRLERLQHLEWTGLEKALGSAEVNWLAGVGANVVASSPSSSSSSSSSSSVLNSGSGAVVPLPMLRQLVFKCGYSMAPEALLNLKERRPDLDIQLTNVKDA